MHIGKSPLIECQMVSEGLVYKKWIYRTENSLVFAEAPTKRRCEPCSEQRRGHLLKT